MLRLRNFLCLLGLCMVVSKPARHWCQPSPTSQAPALYSTCLTALLPWSLPPAYRLPPVPQAAAERRATELEDLWQHHNERASLGMMSSPTGAGPAAVAGSPAAPSDAPSPSKQRPPQEPEQAASAKSGGGGLFATLFGISARGPPPPLEVPSTSAPSASTSGRRGRGSSAKPGQQSPAALVTDLERQQLALRAELGVVKAELAKWRGFTDEQEVLISPSGSPTGERGREE